MCNVFFLAYLILPLHHRIAGNFRGSMSRTTLKAKSMRVKSLRVNVKNVGPLLLLVGVIQKMLNTRVSVTYRPRS